MVLDRRRHPGLHRLDRAEDAKRQEERNRESREGNDGALRRQQDTSNIQPFTGQGLHYRRLETRCDDGDLVTARGTEPHRMAHQHLHLEQLLGRPGHELERAIVLLDPALGDYDRDAQALDLTAAAREGLDRASGLVFGIGRYRARALFFVTRCDFGTVFSHEYLLVWIDGLDRAVDLVEVELSSHAHRDVTGSDYARHNRLRLALEILLGLAAHFELRARPAYARAGIRGRKQPTAVVQHGDLALRQAFYGTRDQRLHTLDERSVGCAAAIEPNDNRGLTRLIAACQEARFAQGEMHLRTLHATHVRERPLQLSLERSTIVDALREVGHAPRRLIENLETGRVGGPRQALLRQQDTSFRREAVRNRDHLPTACELEVNARFFQALGGLADTLDGEPASDGYVAGGHPPMDEAPDGCDCTESHQNRGRPWPSTESGKSTREGVCHWDLLLHLHHRAVRLGELVADLDEHLEGDSSLCDRCHHLVDFDGLAA